MDNRKLDELVAEKVTGWEWRSHGFHNPVLCKPGSITGPQAIPHYSTDISDAWEAIGKFNTFHVSRVHSEFYVSLLTARGEFTAQADTVPMAICLATLKAKGASM